MAERCLRIVDIAEGAVLGALRQLITALHKEDPKVAEVCQELFILHVNGLDVCFN